MRLTTKDLGRHDKRDIDAVVEAAEDAGYFRITGL